ncbi:N-succinylarginine dihydrolase [Sphingomonas sp. TF3]|uniref:N-succinylarginine dihydrolase n=1 Tax=unclassified Sphingomonas TaxID=196159 RepID=UPI000F862ECA|nr:N-succinylarginine dihydrolase [Sphingomonas sp. TF3]RUN75294.1 N-succinylarginine dihydrolase [Sphingomonas sp. TF3]
MIREINFDGIIGPSHNYAGLSHGNLAATRNAGATAYPRRAALEGVAKMRANLALGLTQGILLPHDRPNRRWLAALSTRYDAADPVLQAQAMSASAMWAANAATVSPAPDTGDGRCHLTVANLVTMPHRSHEAVETLRQLRLAFADPAFTVHEPIPAPFGDEGAANHMRLCEHHDAAGIELFVYGVSGGGFPARQRLEASAAVVRAHALDPARTLFIEQAPEAIAAGAFHNDVVAVSNERVLFTHERAFADREGTYAAIRERAPWAEIVEVPADAVSLADAIASYLFNAQLVTLPDATMALIVPQEARENAAVWRWLQTMLAGNGPIRRVEVVDVRQSMANGGGPACLRLRVVADPARVDTRFLVDDARLNLIAQVIEQHWPEAIAPADIGDPSLVDRVGAARTALLETLGIVELIYK